MLLVKELALGESPDINLKKEINKYCSDLLIIVNDDNKLLSYSNKAVDFFNNLIEKWIIKKGQSYFYAIKDSSEFTQFMLSEVRQEPNLYDDKEYTNVISIQDFGKLFRGRVYEPKKDKHGKYFGFITRQPDNIFFHQEDNEQIVNWEILKGKDVTYSIKDGLKGQRAVDVKIIDEQ